jgi:TRAP-type mannitol/chloroaromatic compound transport system permease large subunit
MPGHAGHVPRLGCVSGLPPLVRAQPDFPCHTGALARLAGLGPSASAFVHACGTICASGTLGQIIPPSLVLILLGEIMNESVGTLFAAALLPGMLLAGLYIAYILWVAWRHPERAPPIPASERALLAPREMWLRLAKGTAPALGLVLAVLGSIMAGVAAPT